MTRVELLVLLALGAVCWTISTVAAGGGALTFLPAASFVVDPSGKLTYVEIVPEVAEEPNYDAALAALKEAAG